MEKGVELLLIIIMGNGFTNGCNILYHKNDQEEEYGEVKNYYSMTLTPVGYDKTNGVEMDDPLVVITIDL